MKEEMRSIKPLAICMAAGILAMGLLDPGLVCVQGQGARPAGNGQPPNPNPKLEDRTRQLAEGRLRSAEMDAAVESENEKHIEAAIVTMKEDFTRIQVLRNDIARALVAHQPLDYELILRQTSEINKRANQLNLYMMAHAPEDKEPAESVDVTGAEMTGALVRLCKLIDSFTENPSLKHADTVDAKGIEKAKTDKAKADKDLLAIIKLSERIRKNSDNLRGTK